MYEHLTAELEALGQEIISRYKQNLADNGHSATGNLANTATFTIITSVGQIGIELSLADYWKYVEEGRSKGKFPPLDSIQNWIKAKSILPREINGKLPSEKSLAFLIGRKIAEEGIRGTHDLENAKESAMSVFEARLAAALQADYDAETVELLKASGILL